MKDKKKDLYFDNLPDIMQESLRCMGLEEEAEEKLGKSPQTPKEHIKLITEDGTVLDDFRRVWQ